MALHLKGGSCLNYTCWTVNILGNSTFSLRRFATVSPFYTQRITKFISVRLSPQFVSWIVLILLVLDMPKKRWSPCLFQSYRSLKLQKFVLLYACKWRNRPFLAERAWRLLILFFAWILFIYMVEQAVIFISWCYRCFLFSI